MFESFWILLISSRFYFWWCNLTKITCFFISGSCKMILCRTWQVRSWIEPILWELRSLRPGSWFCSFVYSLPIIEPRLECWVGRKMYWIHNKCSLHNNYTYEEKSKTYGWIMLIVCMHMIWFGCFCSMSNCIIYNLWVLIKTCVARAHLLVSQ